MAHAEHGGAVPHPFEATAEWPNVPEGGAPHLQTRESFRRNLARSELYGNNPRHWDDRVEHFAREHAKAVEKGKVYATADVHPDVKPFLDAHTEAYRGRRDAKGRPGLQEWDESPQLVMADYLDENGYPLANLLRGHPAMHPEMLRHVLGQTDARKVDPDILDAIQREARRRGNRLSLRFGPALPFRPRVYRPKPRATDLKEREWGKISRYFPEPEMGPRNRRTPVRVLLNATMFRLENQIPLRELETENPDMPPWGSVHSLEARISEAQLWPTIIQQIGRTHLLDILPKMIRSAREPAGGLLGHGKQKVDISGLPTEET